MGLVVAKSAVPGPGPRLKSKHGSAMFIVGLGDAPSLCVTAQPRLDVQLQYEDASVRVRVRTGPDERTETRSVQKPNLRLTRRGNMPLAVTVTFQVPPSFPGTRVPKFGAAP